MPGPGALKFPTISSSLCHSRKLPTKISWPRHTLATKAAASGRFSHPVSNDGGWWRCRITQCATSAHDRIPHPSYSNPNPNPNLTAHLTQIIGFRGRNFLHLSSCSSTNSQREKRRGFCCNFNSSGIATQMGATPSDNDHILHHHHHHHHQHQDDDDGKKPPPPPPSHSGKLLTLPTILTIGRVAAVPLLVASFYVDGSWGPNATTGIFIAAAITDWLDGYLARKMKQGTAFGAFLDPVADKLMVAATLVLLCTRPLEAGIFGQAPWLLTVPSIAIIGREITMSAVREWAASQDGKLSEAVAVNNLGKWKTATQMTALTILLAARDSSLVGSGTLVASGFVLLYISAWLSVWSLVVYMRKIWKVLMM